MNNAVLVSCLKSDGRAAVGSCSAPSCQEPARGQKQQSSSQGDPAPNFGSSNDWQRDLKLIPSSCGALGVVSPLYEKGCPESSPQHEHTPFPLPCRELQAVINAQTDHFGWPGSTIIFSLFLDFAQTQQEAKLGLRDRAGR